MFPTAIIPQGYANEDGDVSDFSIEPEIIGTPLRASKIADNPVSPVFSLALSSLHGDSDIARKAYEDAKAEFDKLPLPARKETSVGAIAITKMQEYASRRQSVSTSKGTTVSMRTKRASRTESKPAAKPKRRSAQVEQAPKQPTASRTIRRVVETSMAPTAANFDVLEIPGLDDVHFDADVIVVLQRLVRNQPVETILQGHWLLVTQNSRGQITEVDLVCDTRDPLVQVTDDLSFDHDRAMLVAVESDGEEFEFEAIQGLFQTTFGVFRFYKILAAFDA